MFDEKVLRAEVAEKWGEHGAHIEVFDHMLKLIDRYRQALIDIRDAPVFPTAVEACGYMRRRATSVLDADDSRQTLDKPSSGARE